MVGAVVVGGAAARRARAGTVGGGSPGRPERRASAGSRNRTRRPAPRPGCRAGRAPARRRAAPNISGLPGRIAIFQKSSAKPRSPSAGLHQVVVADAGAAGGDQQVGAGDRVGRGGDGGAVVARRSAGRSARRRAARTRAARAWELELTMPPGGDRLAGQRDLVAGGQDGDARAAMHREPGMVGRGGEADVARAEPLAGGDDARRPPRNPGRRGGCGGRARRPRATVTRSPSRRRRPPGSGRRRRRPAPRCR